VSGGGVWQPLCMPRLGRETNLQREVHETQALGEWVRTELYRVRESGLRADATTAVAAAAAEETYRITDRLPEWQNETSAMWRSNLQHVWAFLGGDRSQHYPLSRAIADFLLSPLNHNEGQDGPNDFDRPQTVASYSAALSAIAGGVDFGVTAVMQIFDAIDLKYGDDDSDERWAEVQRQIEFVRRIAKTVIGAANVHRQGFDTDVLASIRS
jgi:hypothetical protein